MTGSESQAAVREQTERRKQIRDLLQQAVIRVNMQRFTEPEGSNAYEDYLGVLELEPGHPDALRGIRAIQVRLRRWARVAERRGDWPAAARHYEDALMIEPGSQELAASLQRVQVKLDALPDSPSATGQHR